METALILGLTLMVWAVILFLVWELSKRLVCGRLLSEDELDVFFSAHLEEYVLNECSKNKDLLSHGPQTEPFVSRNTRSYITPFNLSYWYINDVGRVPRWSRWHRLLEIKRRQLIDAI